MTSRLAVANAPLLTDRLALLLRSDAGTTLNGATVAAWADQSGRGAVAARQSAAALQPALVANAKGAFPALRFDGVNDVLTLDSGPSFSAEGFALYAVLGRTTGGNTFGGGVILNNGGTQKLYLANGSALTTCEVGRSDGAGTAAIDATTAMPDATVQLLSWIETGAGAGTLYRNGVSIGTASATNRLRPGATGVSTLGGGGGGAYGAFDWYQLRVYTIAHAAGVQAAVEAELNALYGIF